MLSQVVKIDRLKITGIGLTKDQYAHARQQLPGITDIQKDLHLGNTFLKYTEKSFIQGVNLKSKTEKQSIARLEVGCTKAKHFYLAWTLYPQAINQNQAAFKVFNEAISLLFGELFSYQKSYLNGRVQYLEIAQDYMTIPPGSFISHAPYTKSSNVFKGTQYLGKAYTCYDKRKQLKEVKNQTSKWQNIVRLEAKCRKTGVQPCNLHTLANPFAGLEIACIARLQAIADPEFQEWLELAQSVGTTSALHALPEARRKKFRQHLRDCAAPWYDPVKIWDTWSNALQSIAPETLSC